MVYCTKQKLDRKHARVCTQEMGGKEVLLGALFRRFFQKVPSALKLHNSADRLCPECGAPEAVGEHFILIMVLLHLNSTKFMKTYATGHVLRIAGNVLSYKIISVLTTTLGKFF